MNLLAIWRVRRKKKEQGETGKETSASWKTILQRAGIEDALGFSAAFKHGSAGG